jgi:formylglycine-generating enzyme required for sulfatase activity
MLSFLKNLIKLKERKINVPEMVFVEGGTFRMGATLEEDEQKQLSYRSFFSSSRMVHNVTVSSFYICKYPVTLGLWVSVMGKNPISRKHIVKEIFKDEPIEVPAKSYFKCTGDDFPAAMVSWDDVQGFIRKLNGMTGKIYRLPTEAEWEFAARGGNSSKGCNYSGSNNIDEVAWYCNNSGNKPHPVGAKAPNELGIYDMSGGVGEWVNDLEGNYPFGDQTNPAGPSSGFYRVYRGGSWHNCDLNCRVYTRGCAEPDWRLYVVGFRLVHNAD